MGGGCAKIAAPERGAVRVSEPLDDDKNEGEKKAGWVGDTLHVQVIKDGKGRKTEEFCQTRFLPQFYPQNTNIVILRTRR